MLRKIKVYGKLAKFLKQRVFQADIATAAEAVRFLVTNFPQLEGHMAEQYYRVSVGNYALAPEELHDPAGQQEIRIVPVIAGAGGKAGSIGMIIAGAALIAASIFIPGSTAIFGTTFGKLSMAIGTLGASLALGGVAQLLTPVPVVPTTGPNTEQDPRKSYSFSGIQQTSRQGVPVPIVYGETLVGSVVISAGIDTDRL